MKRVKVRKFKQMYADKFIRFSQGDKEFLVFITKAVESEKNKILEIGYHIVNNGEFEPLQVMSTIIDEDGTVQAPWEELSSEEQSFLKSIYL